MQVEAGFTYIIRILIKRDVLLSCSAENDHSDETEEEDQQHQGVEEGEPVDLLGCEETS
jgi:hypothetical protein